MYSISNIVLNECIMVRCFLGQHNTCTMSHTYLHPHLRHYVLLFCVNHRHLCNVSSHISDHKTHKIGSLIIAAQETPADKPVLDINKNTQLVFPRVYSAL